MRDAEEAEQGAVCALGMLGTELTPAEGYEPIANPDTSRQSRIRNMRLIHVERVEAEGLTFNDAGIIVDANGAEYDAIQPDDCRVYTRFACYLGVTDQIIEQIPSATRIASKENGYRRERLYRIPDGDFVKMIERVNVSGPVISDIPYEEVVEWYQRDVPGPIAMGPGVTTGSVFGAPRLHPPGGGSVITVARRPGQMFVVTAYPPKADLLSFSEVNQALDNLYHIGWCTRQEFVSRHEQIDLGYAVVRAIRDQHLNDMRDLPIPTRGNLFR